MNKMAFVLAVILISFSSATSAGPDIDKLIACIEKEQKNWKQNCKLTFSGNPDVAGKPKDEWSGFFDGVFADKPTHGIGIWSRSPAELILGGSF